MTTAPRPVRTRGWQLSLAAMAVLLAIAACSSSGKSLTEAHTQLQTAGEEYLALKGDDTEIDSDECLAMVEREQSIREAIERYRGAADPNDTAGQEYAGRLTHAIDKQAGGCKMVMGIEPWCIVLSLDPYTADCVTGLAEPSTEVPPRAPGDPRSEFERLGDYFWDSFIFYNMDGELDADECNTLREIAEVAMPELARHQHEESAQRYERAIASVIEVCDRKVMDVTGG